MRAKIPDTPTIRAFRYNHSVVETLNDDEKTLVDWILSSAEGSPGSVTSAARLTILDQLSNDLTAAAEASQQQLAKKHKLKLELSDRAFPDSSNNNKDDDKDNKERDVMYMTKAERRAVVFEFDRFDRNRDGRVDANELMQRWLVMQQEKIIST